jgi:hypothetical protein
VAVAVVVVVVAVAVAVAVAGEMGGKLGGEMELRVFLRQARTAIQAQGQGVDKTPKMEEGAVCAWPCTLCPLASLSVPFRRALRSLPPGA